LSERRQAGYWRTEAVKIFASLLLPEARGERGREKKREGGKSFEDPDFFPTLIWQTTKKELISSYPP